MRHTSTILIVDDEPGARDTLEALLLAEGYNLAFACNGAEALKKAQEFTPSLILLDVMMPEMDGFEVCRQLRSMPLLAEVPVIMVTALDDRDSRLQGIEAGADDFISKPFDFGELRARVRTIIRLDRYRRLLLERAKFEWVIRQAEDGYVIISDDDKILYVNSRARLYLGLSSSYIVEGDGEIISETFLELVQKQYRLEPQEAWIGWPEQPDSTLSLPHYLVRSETQTAEVFWLQVESLELASESDAGRILRLHDVTTEIVAQRNRRGFHTMICHKLRTPLVGLLGSLGFMVQHASTLSTEEVAEFSEMALKSVQRLHSEIEDILQYLNTRSMGKPGEGFSLSHLQSEVNRISENLELPFVVMSMPEELRDVRILLSQRAVELVMWEILENSKKFHPQQNPSVEISISRSGVEWVSIKIKDNGLSLSPEQLSQIWTPYYQGEKYSTGEIKGMGLGLSTVASLVWETGGTCGAYNREDNEAGIVVELVLPVAQDPES
jgi:two-component system cell cycle response regulator